MPLGLTRADVVVRYSSSSLQSGGAGQVPDQKSSPVDDGGRLNSKGSQQSPTES